MFLASQHDRYTAAIMEFYSDMATDVSVLCALIL